VPSVGDLVVDDRLESLKGLRAGKEPAVDEERGSPGHTQRLTFPIVPVDVRPELPGIDALSEGRGIEVEVRRDLAVRRGGKVALVLEDPIVVLPELALLVGAERGLGRRLGFGVIGKRIVAIDESDLVAVGLLDLL
jgi:hypothetical protein